MRSWYTSKALGLLVLATSLARAQNSLESSNEPSEQAPLAIEPAAENEMPEPSPHLAGERPAPVMSDRTPSASGFALRGVGLRGSLAQTSTPEDSVGGLSGGGDLYERGAGVLRMDFWSGRYFDELWIGHGSEGFRYQLAGQLGFGVIGLVDENHGFVLRFVAGAHMRREGQVFSSEVRVPGGELGYSWSRGDRQLEIVGHIGRTLTGRFNPEGQTRDLRGTTYGSSLSFGWGRLRLDADLSRVAARADLGGVWHGRAHFCGLSHSRPQGPAADPGAARRPSGGPSWAACADFRLLRGRTESLMPGLDAQHSQQLVWGLSVVVGQLAYLGAD